MPGEAVPPKSAPWLASRAVAGCDVVPYLQGARVARFAVADEVVVLVVAVEVVVGDVVAVVVVVSVDVAVVDGARHVSTRR